MADVPRSSANLLNEANMFIGFQSSEMRLHCREFVEALLPSLAVAFSTSAETTRHNGFIDGVDTLL